MKRRPPCLWKDETKVLQFRPHASSISDPNYAHDKTTRRYGDEILSNVVVRVVVSLRTLCVRITRCMFSFYHSVSLVTCTHLDHAWEGLAQSH